MLISFERKCLRFMHLLIELTKNGYLFNLALLQSKQFTKVLSICQLYYKRLALITTIIIILAKDEGKYNNFAFLNIASSQLELEIVRLIY